MPDPIRDFPTPDAEELMAHIGRYSGRVIGKFDLPLGASTMLVSQPIWADMARRSAPGDLPEAIGSLKIERREVLPPNAVAFLDKDGHLLGGWIFE